MALNHSSTCPQGHNGLNCREGQSTVRTSRSSRPSVIGSLPRFGDTRYGEKQKEVRAPYRSPYT